MSPRPTDLIQSFLFSRLLTRAGSVLLVAFATNDVLAQAASAEAPGVSSAAILQMLLGLLLVIGVLFIGAFFLRKLNGGMNFGNTGPMRIVGGLMISTRERIVLIEVGDAWIVIGIVPGQIKTLHTLQKGELPVANPGEKSFTQWLKQFSDRKNEPR